jgi:cobalt-zinc-cadmium efflux system protein
MARSHEQGSHGHGAHDHGHDGHSHGVSADADFGKLAIALALILGFMCVEVTVGILASSLALLSDAAHMLTDAAAIGLSLVVVRLAQRPAKGALTYGLKRTEVPSSGTPPAATGISPNVPRPRAGPPHTDCGADTPLRSRLCLPS